MLVKNNKRGLQTTNVNIYYCKNFILLTSENIETLAPVDLCFCGLF